MKILCIIGARCGSKRLPRKNLQKYGDTTLLEWGIQNALKSQYIDLIVVDSEDNEILETAKKYPVETHQREPWLSYDSVNLYIPVKRVFEYYKEYKIAVIMQVDNPVENHEIIDHCIETFLNHGDAEDVSTFHNDRRTGTVRVIDIEQFYTCHPTANIYSVEDRNDFVDIHTIDDLNKANQYLKEKHHDTFEVGNKIREPIEYNTRMIYNHFERYQKAIDLLDIKPSDTVIDASCGQGYGSYLLSKNARVAYGYDINEKHLEKAKQLYSKYTDNLFFDEYPDDLLYLVDKIVCIETLEHVPKNEMMIFFKQLLGYLRRGGDMFITAPIGNDGPSEYNKYHLNEPSLPTLLTFTPFFRYSSIHIRKFTNSYNQEQKYCTLVLRGYNEKETR